MNNPFATSRHCFDLPAVYQVQILGRLPLTWSDSVTDLEIEVIAAPGAEIVTALRGELADQAALYGLLNQLYSLQLTILSVVRFEVAHET